MNKLHICVCFFEVLVIVVHSQYHQVVVRCCVQRVLIGSVWVWVNVHYRPFKNIMVNSLSFAIHQFG